jgi:hypothetical protein
MTLAFTLPRFRIVDFNDDSLGARVNVRGRAPSSPFCSVESGLLSWPSPAMRSGAQPAGDLSTSAHERACAAS